jgi:hypothetical protein
MLGSMCSLHKVAAFGAPDDRRIAIHLLCIDEEKAVEPAAPLLPPDVLKGFRRSPAALGRLVMSLIASKKNSLKSDGSEVSEDAREACEEILSIIFREAFLLIDDKFRRDRIEELYGSASQLGIISPSQWPDPSSRRVNESDSPPAPVLSSDEESKDAESVSTSSSSSDSDSEGASEEENEPRL